ncbi:hypothetical protein Tco_0491392 [Tanacetum coccineum]
MIPRKGGLHDYWRDISTDGDFLGPPLSYTLIRDPELRLCHRMMAHSIASRSQAPKKEVCCWEEERGSYLWWTVSGKAAYLCKFDNIWAWLAIGPERQPDVAAGAPTVTKDAPAIDEGDQAISAPMQAPQQQPPLTVTARTMP